MATFSTDVLTEIRNAIEKDDVPINYTKTQVNAAIQPIENAFEGARPVLNTAINNATTPLVLPAAVKLALVRQVLLKKFLRNI